MQTDVATIQTLSDFLVASGCQYRIFDMGCRLSKLSAKQFAQFEHCQLAYPMPWLKHAWVGVLFWQVEPVATSTTVPMVWFLKLPLDEQGLLIQAVRDVFLSQRLELVGAQMSGVKAAEIEEKLPPSELAFTPDQERMAAFHAHSRAALKQPASSYWEPVHTYFTARVEAFAQVAEQTPQHTPQLHAPQHTLQQAWQHLGVQGFADLSVYLSVDEQLAAQVAKLVPYLPFPVLASLAMQCENITVPHRLAKALLLRGQQASDHSEQIVCLRAISQAVNSHERKTWLHKLLSLASNDDSNDDSRVELLATIASKCQHDLMDKDLLVNFLAACALEQGLFNALVGELMYQKQFRQMILNQVRNPARSEQLARAFGEFMQAS